MKYESVKDIRNEEFRRLTGVRTTPFDQMVLILKEAGVRKKAYGGKLTNGTPIR